MRSITFTIEGIPVPAARPRFTGTHCWDSQKQHKLVIGLSLASQFKGEVSFSGPISMDLVFIFPMPKRLSPAKKEAMDGTPMISKPDLDNLAKTYMDSATGVLYKDDCIIAKISEEKIYGYYPRTIMVITELL